MALPAIPGFGFAAVNGAQDLRLVVVEPDAPATLCAAARRIFAEYGASLPPDVGLRPPEAELAGLPGDYAPPHGRLVLGFVVDDDAAAGCGTIRPLADAGRADVCEMKRLYVRPRFRGRGYGRRITESLIDAARGIGYSTLLLHTLDDMDSAHNLYASLGFEAIAPYYDSPAGGHYLKIELH